MEENNNESNNESNVLDALKELTKAIADLAQEQKKLAAQIELSRKTGKF